MNFDFTDISKDFAGSLGGKKSSFAHYTEEQIEEARKRQKEFGGTFMENLRIVAPDVNPTGNAFSGMNINDSLSGSTVSKDIDILQKNADSITDMIKELNDSIKTDSNMSGSATSYVSSALGNIGSSSSNTARTSSVQSAAVESVYGNITQSDSEIKEESSLNVLDKFKGIDEPIKEKIFGQDDFIRKLIIGFKRPFVSERDQNDALNSLFISGPSDTGKHSSLNILIEELFSRGVLGSKEIFTMDLSLYPGASEENVFIQDLYNGLQNSSSVILFENYEKCNVALLGKLAELVSTGECKLKDRYVMRNGQLVSVTNSLAGDTVGELEAKGKYLVFISDNSIEKLAGVMGAPFVNSLGDVCTTKNLDEEAMKEVSATQENIFISKCGKQLGFNITIEEPFRDYVLLQTSKGRGLKGILNSYADTLKALTELKLERDDISGEGLVLTTESGNPVLVSDNETIDLSSLLPQGYSGELDQVKEELAGIVGLGPVKDYIFSLEEYFGVQKRRKEEGLKAGELNKHMIFTGNPGTGKTTIARIVSKYLKAIGVLSGGQLVEVSRADLVGRYVGHTAPLVNQVIKSALGGVLFIDEAYSLYRGQEDSFGLEAIDTLVKGIEDNRDNLIVILAGYSKEMSDFLETNSGLKSRFPNIIDFPDYNADELLAIAKITAKSKGYIIDEGAHEELISYFDRVQNTNAREAGNGRLVRNKIEGAILNQSRRLVAEKEADLSTLILSDFELNDFLE